MEHKIALENIKPENIPPLYTLDGHEKWARVVDVYDGDTINIIFYVGSELQHHKFRLYGIDTPEMRPLKSVENREQVIDAAKKCKKYLESIILDKTVYIRFRKEEKYGRLMGDIYLDNLFSNSVNKMMVENNFAKEYFGGKKTV
jgi:micrococcal nuclease